MKSVNVFVIILSLLCRISFSQNGIRKASVQETGYHVDVQYIEKTRTQFDLNGLSIKVEPVDPSSLSSAMDKSSVLNGKYSYTFLDRTRKEYFQTKKKNQIRYSDTNSEAFINGLEWLDENNIIDTGDYNSILREALNSDDLSDETDISNPYFLKDQYLSTFKVNFDNKTNNSIRFSNSFELLTENSLLEPLSNYDLSYLLEKSNTLNQYKLANILRYNLDSVLVIPANSSCTKYFSTVPINYNASSIEIKLNSRAPQSAKWDIVKEISPIDNQYIYYELYAYPSTWYYNDVFIIIRNQDINAYSVGRVLYIDEKDLTKELSILIYALYQGKSYYSVLKFTPATYIDLEKKKRTTLPVEMIQIKG
jgi:hypothetical protein